MTPPSSPSSLLLVTCHTSDTSALVLRSKTLLCLVRLVPEPGLETPGVAFPSSSTRATGSRLCADGSSTVMQDDFPSCKHVEKTLHRWKGRITELLSKLPISLFSLFFLREWRELRSKSSLPSDPVRGSPPASGALQTPPSPSASFEQGGNLTAAGVANKAVLATRRCKNHQRIPSHGS